MFNRRVRSRRFFVIIFPSCESRGEAEGPLTTSKRDKERITQADLNMCMLDTIRAKRGELYRIADRNKADKLYVFGSCARQEESEDSDVDFLVRFRKDASLFDQVGIANEFRDFLGRQVDVVSTGSLRRAPRFAHQVLSDYVAI